MPNRSVTSRAAVVMVTSVVLVTAAGCTGSHHRNTTPTPSPTPTIRAGGQQFCGVAPAAAVAQLSGQKQATLAARVPSGAAADFVATARHAGSAVCDVTTADDTGALTLTLAFGAAADPAYRQVDLGSDFQLSTDGPLPDPFVRPYDYLGRYRCGSITAVLRASVGTGGSLTSTAPSRAFGDIVRDHVATKLGCTLTASPYRPEAAGSVAVVAGNGVRAIPGYHLATASTEPIGSVLAMASAPDGSTYLVTTSTFPGELGASDVTDLSDATDALVQLRADGTEHRVELRTGAATDEVPPSPDVVDMAWHSGRLWIVTLGQRADGTLTVSNLYDVDPATGDSHAVLALPYGLKITAGSKTAAAEAAARLAQRHRTWSALTFDGATPVLLDVTHRSVWRLQLSNGLARSATVVPLDSSVPQLVPQTEIDPESATDNSSHPAVGLAGGGFVAAIGSSGFGVERIATDGKSAGRISVLDFGFTYFSHPYAADLPLLVSDGGDIDSIDQHTFARPRVVAVDGLPSRTHPAIRIGTHYSTDPLDGTSLTTTDVSAPITYSRGRILVAIPDPVNKVVQLTPKR